MKLKELKRTVNVCWSPAEHYPVTLAAGSAAQQVDASFSSSSYLELYSLNLDDPGSDLELKSSFQTQQKFQKIVWSGSEVLVGGCDGGLLQFYSSEKLLSNSPDCLLGSSTKHNGNVSSLDINPYQKNLLASGASESEIFIWDLNNTSQPMAPGNKSQPYDHVQGLAWNQQVQHILGSTFATRCVVWDLRKNEPIMKLSDAQSRTRWRSLAWHPSVATQLAIASEDDQVPVIQLWDLRLAASPLATLEGHHKGVMAVSWCRQEPDLLLSAGKDGRVLCWNPNNTQPGGELLAEVCQQQQWVFDVSWSPRDPSLLVASSFDQQVNVYSLLGGSKPETSSQNQNNIMDSFGGMDGLSQLPVVARAAPEGAAPRVPQLPRPPRWLKRPVAAKFSFGGKLVTFDRCPQEAGPHKQVYISQVVSEPDIVEAATELDAVLGAATSQDHDAAARLAEYCGARGAAAEDQHERYLWFFLRASFLPAFKTEVLNLLGFKQDEIPSKFKSPATGDTIAQPDPIGLSRGESTETEAELSTDTSTDLSDAHTLIERKLSNLDLDSKASNVVIPNGEDSTSLICRALVCGNLEEAVELCLDVKRIADALIIASLGSPELLFKVQKYHLSVTASDPVSLLSGALLQSRWEALAGSAAPSCWRQTLAALVTHCEGEALTHAAETLGDRLAQEPSPALTEAATVCYLVGAAPDALLSRWSRARTGDVDSLAKMTSLALLARRAARHRGRHTQAGGKLESILNEYASRLASQGCLHSALNILDGVTDTSLRDRLMHALGLIDQRRQPQPQYGNRTRTASSHSQHKGHYNTASYNQGAAPGYEQPWMTSTTPAQPGWQQQPVQPAPLPPIQPLQPLQPPQTQPPQPPRPGSVGPQGLTSRSKYKVDPSVQASPLYNNYSFNNNPVTSQPNYGYNSPIPDQYQNSSVPNTFAPINPGPNPVNPGLNPINPGLNPINPGLNPVNPGLNPVNPGLNPVNSMVNGSYYTPQPVEPAMQAISANKPMQAGWNDPPMLSSSKPKPKQEVQSQAPITHPLYGVEPPQHVPLAPVPGQQYTGQQYPGQYQPQQQYQAQQYQGQYQGQYEAPQQYQNQYHQQGYQQQPEPAPAPEPVPVQKGPVPEPHVVLQTVFDRMRADCAEKAVNPQMKRKLEDVQRRLETLYDMLREHKLSDAALQTLHTVVAHIQAGDCAGAGAAATALAGGTDFAAAAAFLPGLKVLLQLADQLKL